MPKTKASSEKKEKPLKASEVKEPKKIAKKDLYTAVGRRKTSIARVRLVYEKGPIIVNNKPLEEYFLSELSRNFLSEPFRTTNTLGRWSGSILVSGGGVNSQIQAAVLGIARALVTYDEKFKATLRKKGFLTRDPRAKERKKPGLMGARKRKQSPKR